MVVVVFVVLKLRVILMMVVVLKFFGGLVGNMVGRRVFKNETYQNETRKNLQFYSFFYANVSPDKVQL